MTYVIIERIVGQKSSISLFLVGFAGGKAGSVSFFP
jgi:hypothetical protein